MPALALALVAAATLALSGCWPFGGSTGSRTQADPAVQDAPKPPAGPNASQAAPAVVVSGAEPPPLPPPPPPVAEKFSDLQLKPIGAPKGNEPKTPAAIVEALGSKKVGQRILGLVAAARTRPPEAVRTLEKMVRRDETFAPAAVEVLGLYPDETAGRALLAALRSPYRSARTAATRGLAARGVSAGGEVEKALTAILGRDPDWLVRAAAARALAFGAGGAYGLEAAKALEAGMADARTNELVRLECAAALARTPGNEDGWDYLSNAAADRAGDRAIKALELSAEIGGARGAALLGSALASDRTELWTNAARLFSLVGRDAALDRLAAQLRAGGEPGRRAALALAPYEGERLAPELVKAMEDGSQVVRAAACEALARAAGAAAAPALERKLLDAREPSQVRSAAAAALGAVGGPGSAVTLRGVASKDYDPVARAASRDALELLQARLKDKGPGSAGAAELERLALSHWTLVAAERGGGARLRDGDGEVRSYRPGDQVALGYTLARVLGAGEEPTAPEALMAGPEAADRELVRAILAKGNRAVVLAVPAISESGK